MTKWATAVHRIAATVSAQLPQNLEWPHGTGGTPGRGAMRHVHVTELSSISDGWLCELETSPPAADVDVAEPVSYTHLTLPTKRIV